MGTLQLAERERVCVCVLHIMCASNTLRAQSFVQTMQVNTHTHTYMLLRHHCIECNVYISGYTLAYFIYRSLRVAADLPSCTYSWTMACKIYARTNECEHEFYPNVEFENDFV